MRALWLAVTLISSAYSADPGEVRIRSGPYAPPAPTISAQSNLVEVGVTVHDRQGHAVGGFKAADFTLSDNGGARPITFFSELRAPKVARGTPSPTFATAEPPRARSIALFF